MKRCALLMITEWMFFFSRPSIGCRRSRRGTCNCSSPKKRRTRKCLSVWTAHCCRCSARSLVSPQHILCCVPFLLLIFSVFRARHRESAVQRMLQPACGCQSSAVRGAPLPSLPHQKAAERQPGAAVRGRQQSGRSPASVEVAPTFRQRHRGRPESPNIIPVLAIIEHPIFLQQKSSMEKAKRAAQLGLDDTVCIACQMSPSKMHSLLSMSRSSICATTRSRPGSGSHCRRKTTSMRPASLVRRSMDVLCCRQPFRQVF
jgi:hypothetical protein